MELPRKAAAIFDRFNDGLLYIASAICAFLTIGVTLDVLLRYILNRPIRGMLEICEISLVYLTFLASTWVLRNEGHVRIDIFLNMLGPKGQALINIVTSIIGVFISSLACYYGISVSLDYLQRSIYSATVLEIPYIYILAVIPFGFLMLLIQFIRRGYSYVKIWRASPDKK